MPGSYEKSRDPIRIKKGDIIGGLRANKFQIMHVLIEILTDTVELNIKQ